MQSDNPRIRAGAQLQRQMSEVVRRPHEHSTGVTCLPVRTPAPEPRSGKVNFQQRLALLYTYVISKKDGPLGMCAVLHAEQNIGVSRHSTDGTDPAQYGVYDRPHK